LMLGVALVLENVALVAFGPEPTRVRSSLGAATLWLGPVFFDVARLVTFAVAVALTVALSVFLHRTDAGRMIRAVADNTYGALVIGADARRVYAVAFGVGAACVGAAGALVSPILPFQPSTGLSLSVTSFNIVIIGGMGSLPGAFIGGLLVSVAESLGGAGGLHGCRRLHGDDAGDRGRAHAVARHVRRRRARRAARRDHRLSWLSLRPARLLLRAAHRRVRGDLPRRGLEHRRARRAA